MTKLKYPIGMQSFPEIREKGFAYVDKTQYIALLQEKGKYFFLGRPRRFGKSLFLSTLQAYYEGKRELFDGLAITRMQQEWTTKPVLHIDFTGQNYTDPNGLNSTLNQIFGQMEANYDCALPNETLGTRFQNIILKAYERTGQRAAILIDEYDKPLLDTVEQPELQEQYRNILRGVYGNLKRMDAYIETAFLTGISRFGKLNIFSDLNNLNDISMLKEFEGICGITSEELKKYFHQGIKNFAHENSISIEETLKLLQNNYDGYHFSTKFKEDIYNPFSLINALQSQQISEYWFSTGTPLFLIKRIKSQSIDLQELNEYEVTQPEIENVPFDLKGDAVPILYQTGYLTIKKYSPANGIITLGYPNKEVERGFLGQLLKAYSESSPANRTAFGILKFNKDVENGDIDGFMQRLQSLISSIGYDSFDRIGIEQQYQNVLYLIFKLLGYYCHTEYKTSSGRIDMLIETSRYIYAFEFKLNKSAREALDQINEKGYMLPFKFDGRQIVKIGANFNSETKSLDNWIIE
ncbi:MAG: ATP-binding protein [Clostridium sp.]|nr:ATP-binding protein [Clostridium sp.]